MTYSLARGHKKDPAGRRAQDEKHLPALSLSAELAADLTALEQHHAALYITHQGAFQQLALAAAIRTLADQRHLAPAQLLHAWVG